jgi:alpha-beta hydrolase superfamily lysophospholipase
MTPDEAIHVLPCRGELRASIILLHGYSSHASVHNEDGMAFVSDGIEVVMPDAPGHGHRDDGRLAQIALLPDGPRLEAIHGIAREWIGELPSLVAKCQQHGSARIGLAGISMGGFAALGLLAPPCPFAAIAAVLAAPSLLDSTTITPGEPPVLLGLAGRDTAVPPEPGRQFARDYGAELHEYPESEHFMRGEDWNDLWNRTATFLQRHLNT